MVSLGIGEIDKFPFIDPPEPRLAGDGYRLLRELRAVNPNKRLTSTGKLLARLPIKPRLGRTLLAAAQIGSLTEVLVIVTALAVQDPRERPFDKRQAADEQHARFNQKHSDFSALLELWDFLETQSEELSQSALRRLCRKEFINYKRWREWRDLHRQLKLSLRELGFTSHSTASEYDEIHRALLSGKSQLRESASRSGIEISPTLKRFGLLKMTFSATPWQRQKRRTIGHPGAKKLSSCR